jgi:uncharacterized membrane protein
MLHMKRSLLLFAGIMITGISSACPFCNPEISEAIYDSTFFPNLVMMLSAFIAVGVVVLVLSVLSTRRHRNNLSANPGRQLLNPVPLTTTSLILGIGIGGFIDGIVLHQILQWHEMLSNKLPPTNYVNKSVNMFWDGIFHAFTLLVTFTGLVLLWKLLRRTDIDRSGYIFSGGLLAGWGIFNIIEGIIDHHLLRLHHVKEVSSNQEAWDYGFLGLSVILLLAGFGLMNRRKAYH